MICDNEEQKKMLLEVIRAAPINGNFNNLKPTIAMLAELEQTVTSAIIRKPEKDVKGVG